jgi:hypothetical protein
MSFDGFYFDGFNGLLLGFGLAANRQCQEHQAGDD